MTMAREKAANNKSAKAKAAELLAQMGGQPSPDDEEMRKTRPDIKIIFVSGYPDDAFKKSLDEGEIYSFLPKPFTLNELTQKVKDHLDVALV